MKVIIAGSRCIHDYPAVQQALAMSGFVPTEIVSGAANGVDRLGERLALDRALPLKQFPADWNTHGKAAGFIRNLEMANYADALVLVWDGASPGAANMKQCMKRAGKPYYVHLVDMSVPDATGDSLH